MSSDVSSERFPCPHTESLGAYLLGGLEEDEMHLLRVHIDSCSDCSAELRELRPVADLLHASDLNALLLGDRAEPAPDLAERLVARANAEITQSAASSAARSRLAADLAAVGRISDLEDERRRRRGRRVTFAAAAVAFALGAGSVLGVQQVAERNNDRSPTGERIQFASVKVGEPATSAVSVPGEAPDGSPKAWAWIDTTKAGTYAWLYTRGFEPGKVYRWWFEKADGSRVGLGSFRYPKAQDEEWLICPGSTAVLRSELVYIGATDESGNEVLRQKLPPAPRFENA